MNEHSSCGQPCAAPCGGANEPGPSLSFAEVTARFAREATPGVLDTGRYRMRYFEWGAGPPLIFVHGVCDSSRSFLQPIARLSAHFRCVAYDLPGGRGDGARLRHYRHEHLVDDLLALPEHLKLERAYLMGVSFGATVALRALRREPTRFPRAVLQSGTARRPLRRAEYWLSWLARILPGPAGRIPKREKILAAVHKDTFAGRPEEAWRAFVDTTAEPPLATLAHQAQWLHRLDLRDDLPHIRQPVMLVWGDRDRVMPRAHAEVLREGLPSAGLAVIEGAGHVPCYSHPEALAEVVRRFLTPPASCPGPQACAVGPHRH